VLSPRADEMAPTAVAATAGALAWQGRLESRSVSASIPELQPAAAGVAASANSPAATKHCARPVLARSAERADPGWAGRCCMSRQCAVAPRHDCNASCRSDQVRPAIVTSPLINPVSPQAHSQHGLPYTPPRLQSVGGVAAPSTSKRMSAGIMRSSPGVVGFAPVTDAIPVSPRSFIPAHKPPESVSMADEPGGASAGVGVERRAASRHRG
jgi:hypothetical protein